MVRNTLQIALAQNYIGYIFGTKTLQSDERKLIEDDISMYIYYENKIVYFKLVPPDEQKVVHVWEDGQIDKDFYGGNVYIMNPDGTDKHLLFHTDEFIIGMTSNRRHPLISGDYFGILAGYYTDDGFFTDRVIIANIKTGEFVVTHK